MDIASVLTAMQKPPSLASSTNKSTQIDFSESLLDLCDFSASIMLNDQSELDDPFEYGQAELQELIEFDLPEDLPGK